MSLVRNLDWRKEGDKKFFNTSNTQIERREFMATKEKKTIGLLIGALLMLLAMGSVFGGEAVAASPYPGLSFTLDGCRNNGTIVLPNGSGQFICPDAAYTTGNLGKGWNELDLVPYRLFADAGNSAPDTQTYTVAVVLDNFDAGHPGYDVLSVPVLNTALSSASCTAPTVGLQTTLTPGLGGINQSIYRLVTITQAKNTTCVYDYYGRLALGSHLFPGSSLHANLTDENLSTAGIGARDVSIPVKEIAPQELRKQMSAKEDANDTWSVTKEASPAEVSFDDVCSSDFTGSKDVTITVTWTLLEATPGNITAVTTIYAKNPAARTITVNVTDNIYKGLTQTDLLDTKVCAPFDVPANTESLVCTHTAILPPSDGSVGDYLNDVATATYTDLVTGVPVPGMTTATASAQIIQGTVTNTTAVISDDESISGAGLKYSVADPGSGSFEEGYIPGTPTADHVIWDSDSQSTSGQAIFNKTLYLDDKKVTTGELDDTATLNGSDGFTTTSGTKVIKIKSSASVKLTICKTIPNILDTGDKLDVPFHITRGSDPSYSVDRTLEFVGGGDTTLCTDLTGLVPDSYTVEEKTADVCFYAAADPNTCLTPIGLQPSEGSQQTVNLSLDQDNKVTACSGTATFNNELTTAAYATAKVCKVTNPILEPTDPDYYWNFTLTNTGVDATATAGANAECVPFDTLLGEGNYTVTETTKTGWDLNSAVPNDGTITTLCKFTVDLPEDSGKVFTCTFTNTKRGKAKVVKTVQGQPPTGDQSFTFQLRKDASTTQVGTILESQSATAANGGIINFVTLLIPANTYQLCEIVMPGWMTTLGTFVPNSFMPPDGVPPNPNVDNSILCVNFTVNPGETKTFTVDNTPPPGGRALTIGFWKNWASCSASKGKQEPVLDETLAAATPPGIQVGSFYLVTGDCATAVHLLNKEDCSGKKKASDPLFNMVAQLIAAELNLASGAYTCPAVAMNITAANNLLIKYSFTCSGYTVKLSAADATLANNLAKFLDNYNNNRSGVCP